MLRSLEGAIFLLHHISHLFKIAFYKMAPVAFFFAAAGVKIMRHYFLVNRFYLAGHFSGIIRSDRNFFFVVFTIMNRFNKFKYGAYHLPI